MRCLKTWLLGLLCIVAVGCGSSSGSGLDASSLQADAAASLDAGILGDVGVGPADVGLPDAGAPDAAEPPDAQAPIPDAGAADAQTSPPDGGPSVLVVTDIRDLQDSTRPNFVPAGSRVRVQGAVVTLTATATRTFFFVQNPTGPAEHSGIRVGKGFYSGAFPSEGSTVTALEATVVEAQRGTCAPTDTCPLETSLVLAGLAPITTTPGGTLPTPAVVTTASLAANPGAFEGVLVEIDGTTAVNVGLLANEQAIWIEDGLVVFCIFYVPVPPPLVGATITRLVGPVAPYGPLWEIYPSHASDLVFVNPPVDAGVPDGG